MKPYPKYKDSGIERLGEVPEGWPAKRLRFCLKLNPSKQEIRHLPKDTELPFIPMEAVGEAGSLDLSNTRPIDDVENGYTFFRNNDVAIAKITPCFENGKGCIFRNLVHDYGFGTTELTVMRPRHLDPAFLYYLTISHQFRVTGIGLMQGSAGQKRVPDDYIRDYIIGLPSEAEQQAIATFLDQETAKIDALIQKKERMIELLKEKRVALITQAVTKGLDPNVPMKDSGIEWLGEVPEHWEVLPIKYIVSTPVTDGPHETPEILDEGVPFISAESIKGGKIDFELKRGFISIEDDLRYSKKYKPMMNDIYVIKSGATTGNSAMVETDIEFNIWSPLAVIRCNKVIADPHFVFLYVNSNEFITAIQLFWSFGTQQNIGMNIIENLQVPLPPISEQINICKGSKMELERIEALQNKIADSISLLREYRSSLIHHAVTGKIDLRGYDAQAQ